MSLRRDYSVITDWIAPGARVLDLGCGDGTLMKLLKDTREISGYGIEIDDAKIPLCIANGVNVLQRDLEGGLRDLDDQSFDCVILSQTLQAMRHTELVLAEMLRIGREAIVTFPNFGYWHVRLQLLMGRMPVSDDLPYQWYDTPNVHLFTIADFEALCAEKGYRVISRQVLAGETPVQAFANIRGSLAMYRLTRG